VRGRWLVAVLSVIAPLVVAVLVGRSRADAARADFVGTATCVGCHAAAGAVWEKSAHADAAAVLGAQPKARCLGCHTTGDAPAGASWFAEVGCESCHGAGAGYAEDDLMRDPTLARELGLRELSTPEARAHLCAGCHRPGTRTRSTPFDLEAAWRAIEH
jgi:hypothetical protein